MLWGCFGSGDPNWRYTNPEHVNLVGAWLLPEIVGSGDLWLNHSQIPYSSSGDIYLRSHVASVASQRINGVVAKQPSTVGALETPVLGWLRGVVRLGAGGEYLPGSWRTPPVLVVSLGLLVRWRMEVTH